MTVGASCIHTKVYVCLLKNIAVELTSFFVCGTRVCCVFDFQCWYQVFDLHDGEVA